MKTRNLQKVLESNSGILVETESPIYKVGLTVHVIYRAKHSVLDADQKAQHNIVPS